MPDAGSMPLIALLGRAHDALEADFDARLREHADFPGLSLAHSRNVLRHLDREDCTRASQLVSRTGISKQALSLQIAHLEKGGYVAIADDPDDRRARRVVLTPLGVEAQKTVRRILTELDSEWRERWGAEGWEAVRGYLVSVVSRGDRSRDSC